MRWWLKAHQTGPLAAVIVGLGCFTWLAASGRALGGSVASPVKAGSAVPIILWLPLAIVAALCWACSVDDLASARAVSIRSNRLLLTGFIAATMALAAAAVAPAAFSAPLLTAGVVRNIVGLVGLATILRPRIGAPAASATTAGYVAIAALLGAEPDGHAAWWAWPTAQHLDSWGPIAAGTLFAAGLATTALPTSRLANLAGPSKGAS